MDRAIYIATGNTKSLSHAIGSIIRKQIAQSSRLLKPIHGVEEIEGGSQKGCKVRWCGSQIRRREWMDGIGWGGRAAEQRLVVGDNGGLRPWLDVVCERRSRGETGGQQAARGPPDSQQNQISWAGLDWLHEKWEPGKHRIHTSRHGNKVPTALTRDR